MKKLSLNDACTIAEEHSGVCLSTEYKNNRIPLIWRCFKIIHEMLRFSELKIQGNVKLTLENAKKIALLRNGQCLSEKYINNQLPLSWSCIKGHSWYASLNNAKCHGKC